MSFEALHSFNGLLAAAPAAVAVAGGILAAQAAGPLWCGWPTRTSELRIRLAALTRRAPGALRFAMGAALLAVVMLGGGLAAYATAPPLARATLTGALRAAVATQGDQAALPTIGTAPKPETTDAAKPEDQAPTAPLVPAGLQGEIASGRWDGRPAWGLDQAQTERLIAYDLRRDQAYTQYYSKNFIPGQQGSQIPGRPTEAEILGTNTDDYRQLASLREAYRAANYQAEMATPLSGPSSIQVRADQVPIQAVTAAGADPRGVWILGPADDDGSRTMTRTGSSTYSGGALTGAMPLANWGRRG